MDLNPWNQNTDVRQLKCLKNLLCERLLKASKNKIHIENIWNKIFGKIYLIKDIFSIYIKYSWNSTTRKQTAQLKKTDKIYKATSHQRSYRGDKKAYERCSAPYSIKELQIKTVSYYYISLRRSKTKKNKKQNLIKPIAGENEKQ